MNRSQNNSPYSPSRGASSRGHGTNKGRGFRRMRLWNQLPNYPFTSPINNPHGWSSQNWYSLGCHQSTPYITQNEHHSRDYTTPNKTTPRQKKKFYANNNNNHNNNNQTKTVSVYKRLSHVNTEYNQAPQQQKRHKTNTSIHKTEEEEVSNRTKKFKRNKNTQSKKGPYTKKSVQICEKDEVPESVPKEALHCEICSLQEFTSLVVYNLHINSKFHKRRQTLTRQFNDSILAMLKANAKLMNSTKPKHIATSSKMSFCFKCSCHYWVTEADHLKSTEHQLIKAFTMKKCCGRVYHYCDPAGNYQIEDHIQSPWHLKQQYMKKHTDSKDVESSDEDLQSLPLIERIKLMKGPRYNPNEPFGEDLVVEFAGYFCKACSVHLKSTEEKFQHCKTIDHFKKSCTFVQKNMQTKSFEDPVEINAIEREDDCKMDVIENSVSDCTSDHVRTNIKLQVVCDLADFVKSEIDAINRCQEVKSRLQSSEEPENTEDHTNKVDSIEGIEDCIAVPLTAHTENLEKIETTLDGHENSVDANEISAEISLDCSGTIEC